MSCILLKGENAPGSLELVTANLFDVESLEKAIAGAACVIHTAAAVKMQSKDPQKDIVDVAVEGTRNVLSAITKATTVRYQTPALFLPSSCTVSSYG